MIRSAFFALALGLFGTLATAPEAQVTGTANQPLRVSASMDNGVQMLNAYRRSAGLSPLRASPRLTAAAAAHAAYMASGNYGHVGRGGSTIVHRAQAQGYCVRALAENIAWGIPSAEQVMQGWMGSTGHRRNILTSAFTEFGLSGQNGMWVLMLGRPC